MSRTPLLLAASLAALIAASSVRADDQAVPSANDVAGTLASPVVMPTEAPPVDMKPVDMKPAEVKPAAAEAPKAEPAAQPAPAVAETPAAPKVEAPAEPVKAVVTIDPGIAAREALVAELHTATGRIDLVKGTAEEKKDRAAIRAFYDAHNGSPVFMTGLGLSDIGKSVALRLSKAAEDGLNPADYRVPVVADGASATDLASAELAFAEAALRYARQAQGGRFSPLKVSDLVTPKIVLPDPAVVLADLAIAKDPGATLEAYNPPHEGYKRLKAKLADLRVNPEPPLPAQVMVPEGPTLKPGVKDARIALLRQRLSVPAGEGADAELYDQTLVDQVRLFQKDRDLPTNGIVGPSTLTALNKKEAPSKATEADLIVNMERWRWLPRDLGTMNVFVNIPGFYLDINRNGQSIHHTRVIVGRTANPTPVFSEVMTHVIVNPYWNVPVSIIKKEMLGNIQASGGAYLDRGNYEVLIKDKVVASNEVDWANVNPNQVQIRQRPGGGNALGNIKFMFPNQHSVYIHDTSSRGLFSQDYRSLSHGCVRVFEPFKFADKLLVEEPTGLTGAKLQAMVGGSEKTMWLGRKINVHLTYFTATVDTDGTFAFRKDLYGYDAKMKQIMGL
jgi:murein L,D-transpeptidase YcbB/YkuD